MKKNIRMIETGKKELQEVDGGSEIGFMIGYYLKKGLQTLKEAFSENDSKELRTLQSTNPVSVWN